MTADELQARLVACERAIDDLEQERTVERARAQEMLRRLDRVLARFEVELDALDGTRKPGGRRKVH